MKIKSLITKNNGNSNTSTLLTSEFRPTPEFEHLFEWVRLGASHVRKNVACIEEHRQSLRSRGETEKRLSELDRWRQSFAFTDREKAALDLSQTISLHEPEELGCLILKEAQLHFNTHQIVRLTLTVLAVNDWIDFHAKSHDPICDDFLQQSPS